MKSTAVLMKLTIVLFALIGVFDFGVKALRIEKKTIPVRLRKQYMLRHLHEKNTEISSSNKLEFA